MRNLAAFLVGACVMGVIGAEAWGMVFTIVGMHHRAFIAACVFLVCGSILLVLEFLYLKGKKV